MSVSARVARPEDLPALLALRQEVFVTGQGVDPDIERDGLDGAAVHAYAWTDDPDSPVGTGRLLGEPPAPARVGRMAVREDARGTGVGAAVLRLLEREAVHRGHHAVVLHAQTHAAGFYRRMGYVPVGPEFTEAGIRHVEMRRALPVVRDIRDDDSAALVALIAACWAEYPGCVLDVDGEEPWLRAPARAYAAYGGRMWVAELACGTDVTGDMGDAGDMGGDTGDTDTSDPGGKGATAVVGCVGLRPGSSVDEVELKSLYIAAAARRRGLGEVLTGLVEREATARGARRVALWSDTRFVDAHRLYARLGYRRLPGIRELRDLSGSREYAFVKDLAAPG